MLQRSLVPQEPNEMVCTSRNHLLASGWEHKANIPRLVCIQHKQKDVINVIVAWCASCLYSKAFKPEGNNRKSGKEMNSLLRAVHMGHLCRSLLLFVGSVKALKCHREVAVELLQAAPNSFVADVSGFPSVWRLGSEIHCNRLSCSTKQATLSAPRKRNMNSSER